ncbi:MAG TPA: hypothetical protein VNI78_04150 [Vicinamibacterales bacterium]|nr:hypothetical protein [Vicinamibacterales bacterium]
MDPVAVPVEGAHRQRSPARDTASGGRGWLAATLTAQVLLSLALWRHLAAQLNPDAVAYGRAAELWVAGRPRLALNATWGALSPLLAVPGLLLGADPVDALRGSQIACGLLLTLGTNALLQCLGVAPALRIVLVLAAALHTSYAATAVIASDVSYTAVFVWLCWTLLTPRTRVGGCPRPLLAGMLAALAYVARPAGLGMGLTMLAATEWWHARTDRRAGAGRRRTAVLAGCGWAAIGVPWLLALGLHYGHLPLAHSAGLVHAAVGPHAGHPWNLPSFTRLHRPPDGRVTTWEDPSLLDHATLDWSPFASPAAWRHQRDLAAGNARAIIRALMLIDGVGLALVALVLVPVLGMYLPRPPAGWREPWLLLAPALHVLALTPLHVEARYLWPVVPIGLGALGALGTRVLAAGARGTGQVGLARAAAVGLVVLPPLWHHATMAAAFLMMPARDERAIADEWAGRLRAAGAVGPTVSWSSYPEKALDPEGLYLAWRTGQPWLANLSTDGRDLPDAVALGARVLVAKSEPGAALPEWLARAPWSPLLATDVRGRTLRDGRYVLLVRR